jgi:hypothetical protein
MGWSVLFSFGEFLVEGPVRLKDHYANRSQLLCRRFASDNKFYHGQSAMDLGSAKLALMTNETRGFSGFHCFPKRNAAPEVSR